VATDTSRIRIILIDDHELIRHGLRRVFNNERDFDVVGEGGGVAEALSLADTLEPDVVIVDVRLRDGSGFDVTRSLRSMFPALGIVVVTVHAGDDGLFHALEAGASAFVSKAAPASDVVAAARLAVASPTVFTAADLSAAVKRRLHQGGPRLPDRERQILDHLAAGWTILAIAVQLQVSESTINKRIRHLYQLLGVDSRSEAIVVAAQDGLLPRPGSHRVAS
jgi:DNA-binding NarL/FixJ family response regulator